MVKYNSEHENFIPARTEERPVRPEGIPEDAIYNNEENTWVSFKNGMVKIYRPVETASSIPDEAQMYDGYQDAGNQEPVMPGSIDQYSANENQPVQPRVKLKFSFEGGSVDELASLFSRMAPVPLPQYPSQPAYRELEEFRRVDDSQYPYDEPYSEPVDFGATDYDDDIEDHEQDEQDTYPALTPPSAKSEPILHPPEKATEALSAADAERKKKEKRRKRFIGASALVTAILVAGPTAQAYYHRDEAAKMCVPSGIFMGFCYVEDYIKKFKPENFLNVIPPAPKIESESK